jgi:hypothetical protein
MSGYVPDDPLALAPGVAEMLSDPAHFRLTPCEVVDYSDTPMPAEDLLPSFSAQPQPEPSYWQRLWAALRGRA